MTLWEEIQPWIDRETGLMTAPDGGRDNLLLMTAYAVRDGAADPQLGLAVDRFCESTRVAPGLHLRRPGDHDDNSVDNLIGICYLRESEARAALKRWNSFFACFDVNNPTKIVLNKNFYGRFLGLKTFLIAATGAYPDFFQRLVWIAANYFTDWTSKGTSDRLLMSLQVEVMRKHCPKTCARWDRRNPLYGLYLSYFGSNFPLTTRALK